MTLWTLGEPGQARPLLERALEITEGAKGPDHPEVAATLNNLATILKDLGEPGQAHSLFERAAAIDERHPDGPSRIRRLRRDRLAD
jgi:Tfp pilus assembly protein PilF